MGVYMSSPVREKISEDGDNDVLRYGSSTMQGWKRLQENVVRGVPDFLGSRNTSLFALFEGHGGVEVAQYSALHYPDHLATLILSKSDNESQTSDNSNDESMVKTLCNSFFEFDSALASNDVRQILFALAGRHGNDESEKLRLDTDGKDEKNDDDYDDDDDDEDDDDPALLVEEAFMPLDEVLEQYRDKSETDLNSVCIDRKITRCNVDYIDSSAVNTGENLVPCDRNASISLSTQCDLNSKSAIVQESSSPIESNNGQSISSEVSTAIKDSEEEETCSKQLIVSEQNVPAASTDAEQSAPGYVEKRSCRSKSGGSAMQGAGCSGGRRRRDPAGPSVCRKDSDDDEEEEEEDDSEDGGMDGEQWDPNQTSDDDNSESESGDDDDDDDSDNKNSDQKARFGANHSVPIHPGFDNGCSALVALIRDRHLYIANAGISKVVICRNGKAVDISVGQQIEKAEDGEEIVFRRKRRQTSQFKSLHAFGYHSFKISQDDKVPIHELTADNNSDEVATKDNSCDISDEMTSANQERDSITLTNHKTDNVTSSNQRMTSHPDVTSLRLEDDDEFLVIMSEGIWKVLGSQDVVNFVNDCLRSQVSSLSSVCEQLFDVCLAPTTNADGIGCDNMSCIVITFKKHASSKNVEDITCLSQDVTSLYDVTQVPVTLKRGHDDISKETCIEEESENVKRLKSEEQELVSASS